MTFPTPQRIYPDDADVFMSPDRQVVFLSSPCPGEHYCPCRKSGPAGYRIDQLAAGTQIVAKQVVLVTQVEPTVGNNRMGPAFPATAGILPE